MERFTFIDDAKREWELVITLDEVERIRDELKICLLTVDPDDLEGFFDPLRQSRTAVEIIWLLIGRRAKELGVTREQWQKSMGGGALSNALFAYSQALANFFLFDPTLAVEWWKNILGSQPISSDAETPGTPSTDSADCADETGGASPSAS